MSRPHQTHDHTHFEEDQVIQIFLDTFQDKLRHEILKPPRQHEEQALRQAILYPGAYVGGL